jgi:hypothetical protein
MRAGASAQTFAIPALSKVHHNTRQYITIAQEDSREATLLQQMCGCVTNTRENKLSFKVI